MEQPRPLTSIKCAACGAGVQIAPDATTAACSFCGNQQLVHSSIPVAHQVAKIGNSVGNVDRSTARLAAEMALPRLYAERQQCFSHYNYLCSRQGSSVSPWDLLFLVATFLVSSLLAMISLWVNILLAPVVLVGGMVTGFVLTYRAKKQRDLKGTKPDPELVAAHARLRELDARIAENYRIANS